MRFLSIVLLLLILFSCKKNSSNNFELIDFVPKNTHTIIKTADFVSFKSGLNNNDFYQNISKSEYLYSLKNGFSFFDDFKPESNTLICFSKDENDSTQYSVITKYNKDIYNIDSLPNYVEETITYNNKTITKFQIDKPFYSTINDSVLFISSSLKLTKASTIKLPLDLELKKLYNTTDKEKNASIIFNNNVNPTVNSFFLNDSINSESFTNYISVDADISQNEILFNGITKATDSSESLINVFKNTIPQKNELATVTPSNSDGFLSFTFNNFNDFNQNLSRFNKQDSIVSTTTLFDNIIEVGVIYKETEIAVVLNSIDVISTNDALLSEKSLVESFRQINIYNFSDPGLFSQLFMPFITFNTASKYCVIDNFFVFGDTVETLQNIITSYQNNFTLSERDYFKEIQKELSNQSSLITVLNNSSLKRVLNKNLNKTLENSLENYKVSALQFVYDTNFSHVNAVIKKDKIKGSEHSISELLNIKLDSELLTDPQLVTNHYSKEKEIVVQDINNNLYLISNKGKILWKKQLKGEVLGKIEQVDLYKNGRLQLIFTTPHRLYVLDRNGNDVAPFPGKFNNEITQPLSIFDYDNRKNYRLVVTQGKQLLMYNSLLQIVKGFTFKSASNKIIQQPQHFRIGRKDYITIKTENEVQILDRTGKTRVIPKSSKTYSNQKMYVYNNKFTTTSKNGELISIDTKGNMSTQKLDLTDQHNIDATSKTLVTMYENKLKIKSRTLELDYGTYTKPKIFYIKDKIYITLTDLQTQKVYLFDSQAKSISNFPVYGNSIISLDNIDADKNLEFIVKGDSNNILVYKIN